MRGAGDPSLRLKSGSAQDDATKKIQTDPLPKGRAYTLPQPNIPGCFFLLFLRGSRACGFRTLCV